MNPFLNRVRAEVERQVMQELFWEFLKDWLCWAETGISPSGAKYTGTSGLCFASSVFLNSQRMLDAYSKQSLRHELYNRFSKEGLDIDYPFGRGAFAMHMASGSLHTDPTRLAWVRRNLPEHHLQHAESFIGKHRNYHPLKVTFK